MIAGKQRILAIKPDLVEAARLGSMDNRIAKLVEASEIDPLAMGKQLLIKRD